MMHVHQSVAPRNRLQALRRATLRRVVSRSIAAVAVVLALGVGLSRDAAIADASLPLRHWRARCEEALERVRVASSPIVHTVRREEPDLPHGPGDCDWWWFVAGTGLVGQTAIHVTIERCPGPIRFLRVVPVDKWVRDDKAPHQPGKHAYFEKWTRSTRSVVDFYPSAPDNADLHRSWLDAVDRCMQ